MSDMHSKRIAVVGVSSNEDKYGFKIFRDLLSAGYTVEGVNPRGGEVLGRKIFTSLGEIPEKPALVITVVPPAATRQVVEECHQLGIGEIWMQPGSDSPEAVTAAEEYGMAVTHNACIMVQRGLW